MDLSVPSCGGAVVNKPRLGVAGMPISAVGLLGLSAVVAFTRSHYMLLGGDEFGFGLLDFDARSSIAQLIHVELTKPTILDPIAYNLLLHTLIRWLGKSALVIRLPAILGYLTMQVCVFYSVKKIATERAATVALALPALAGTVLYGIVERPYGVLLGLLGVAMLSWQTAAGHGRNRTLALVLLAVSLATAINTQYYGVLFFIPLCLAEFVRTIKRRRLDPQMAMSIAIGLGGLIVGLPFVKAMAPFRAFHNNVRGANLHFVTHSFLWLLVGYADLSIGWQHLIGFTSALLLFILAARYLSSHLAAKGKVSPQQWTFVVALTAYPFWAYLLAIFETHFVEVRYIVPAVIGVAALVAFLLADFLENDTFWVTVLLALFSLITANGIFHVLADRRQSKELMASLTADLKTQRSLDQFEGQPIYVMGESEFEFIHYYYPSADVRRRVTLVYPKPKYWPHGGEADVSLQARNTAANHFPNVASYGSMATPKTERLVLLVPFTDERDWSTLELANSHAHITMAGELLGSELAIVRFP